MKSRIASTFFFVFASLFLTLNAGAADRPFFNTVNTETDSAILIADGYMGIPPIKSSDVVLQNNLPDISTPERDCRVKPRTVTLYSEEYVNRCLTVVKEKPLALEGWMTDPAGWRK